MLELIVSGIAIVMAGIILARCIRVLHLAVPGQHRERLLFYGFGYSYVMLGAGSIFAALALVAENDLEHLALWLLLAGSTGLILFDRHQANCWTVTDCPLDKEPPT